MPLSLATPGKISTTSSGRFPESKKKEIKAFFLSLKKTGSGDAALSKTRTYENALHYALATMLPFPESITKVVLLYVAEDEVAVLGTDGYSLLLRSLKVSVPKTAFPKNDPTAMMSSDDGRFALCSYKDEAGAMLIRNHVTHDLPSRIHRTPIKGRVLAVSGSGRWGMVVDRKTRVQLWRLLDSETMQPAPKLVQQVTSTFEVSHGAMNATGTKGAYYEPLGGMLTTLPSTKSFEMDFFMERADYLGMAHILALFYSDDGLYILLPKTDTLPFELRRVHLSARTEKIDLPLSEGLLLKEAAKSVDGSTLGIVLRKALAETATTEGGAPLLSGKARK